MHTTNCVKTNTEILEQMKEAEIKVVSKLVYSQLFYWGKEKNGKNAKRQKYLHN